MTLEEKISVLESLSEIAPLNASAEDEDNLISYFLPLRSYSKLADEKVFLVTGGRGTGKSELFKVLTSEGGLNYLLSEADRKRHTKLKQSMFLVGYQASGREGQRFPVRMVFDRYAKVRKEEQFTCIWGGLLCSVLLNHFSEDKEFEQIAETFLGMEQMEVLRNYSNTPEKWLPWMNCNLEKWEVFLDHCDSYFNKNEKTVFITYDELDRVCSVYKDLFLYIRNLLNFWFVHNNRWVNLKAKIFLRSDLYNSKVLHFVDSSKMRAYHLELQWDSISLYRLLVKRLANCGNPAAVEYLQSIPGLLADRRQGELGYFPNDSEEALKQFIEKLIGKYMGKNPKKGSSFSWVPNHIQDANGEVAPRPFLKCFVFAAEDQVVHKSEVETLEDDRLLYPSRLQGALTKVSNDRVNELIEYEYGWLKMLSEKLEGQSMLMERSELLKFLTLDNWPEGERETLPGTTPEELLDALEKLGIFIETIDGRMNVPEIYLHGFGLKRRGGIKRPRG